ncbi:hypothetical protein N7478_000793 [Penicillium angulare]|uniref:uncharacterized protein n=1 Tax=Penicillium angulare TaxID=116970 RepID=UPI002540A8D7|nr:uncharacterized protein N7478_000793 [Penicillium angulare]KAJ5291542.1 hypothetical protein N7478_000793 [Penicillium angulare]
MGCTPRITKQGGFSSFEGRLKRAFSSSSSAFNESHSSASSITGDTTEDETHPENVESLQRDGKAGVKRRRTSDEGVSLHSDPERIEIADLPDELEIRGTMVLECLADLDTRVNRIQHSMSDQTDLDEIVDLENVIVRLSAIESTMRRMTEGSRES